MDYHKIKDESMSISDWIISIRRELHEHPELMYEEFKTSELIRRELDKLENGEGTSESHAKFKKELGGLPFPLLADPDRNVADKFLVPVHLGMFPAKSSFLIGPDDRIHHVYDWLFRPRRHVARILKSLSSVTGGSD